MDGKDTIFLVDDDVRVLAALSRLLREKGYEVASFSSPGEFLEKHDSEQPGCAVLDVTMPGLSGLDLQRALSAGAYHRPVIFITGGTDIPTTVNAMKAGAVDYLAKPVHDSELLGAIEAAIERDHVLRAASRDVAEVRQRYETLTPREREVLAFVVAGRLNKQIAGDLGTVEKTVKVHRARVMEKMKARSLAELVRLGEIIGITAPVGRPKS